MAPPHKRFCFGLSALSVASGFVWSESAATALVESFKIGASVSALLTISCGFDNESLGICVSDTATLCADSKQGSSKNVAANEQILFKMTYLLMF